MPNYLLNTDVLNKMDLKIIYYSLRPFSLRLSIFIGIGKNGLYPPRENGHIRSLFYGLAMKIQI